jgi:AIPR protein
VNDRLIMVFATERPLTDDQRIILNDIRTMGREHVGGLFDVEAISVETIYSRLAEETPEVGLRVPLRSHLVPSGADLLVGSTRLTDLYQFLVDYRDETGDLDGIYEKNVRRFLGGRGKVNKGMQDTLRDAPERFGLYNNGITIVASDWTEADGHVELVAPYIVNGCQTSRTIWEVFHRHYRAGGTGINPEIEAWKARATDGTVVTKIVKVGSAGEQLLQAITRYTNSQNAVREKDFLALSSDFSGWKIGMADTYNIYLEVQRGGWDSQKALQNANPATRQFERHVNAADLIKVYGAGWFGEVGLAFGKNPPFLPGGSVFKRITATPEEGQEPFGVEDLYACYLLQEAADELKFGRGGPPARRQSRFVFYMVVITLLRDTLNRVQMPSSSRSLSIALGKVLNDEAAKGELINQAVELIEGYFTQGSEDSIHEEPALRNTHFGDLNAFLKAERFGRSRDFTPKLFDSLALTQKALGKSYGGRPSARDAIVEAIKGD